jgi:hypothetical protein
VIFERSSLCESRCDGLLTLCRSAKKLATSSMKIAGRDIDATFLPLACDIDRKVAATER